MSQYEEMHAQPRYAGNVSPDDHEKKGDVYNPDNINVTGAGAEPVLPREEETHRSLKPRQISMIAIGGAIGE
jgi:amino acid transporter